MGSVPAPVRGTNLLFWPFSQNLHKIENIWTWERGHTSLGPPSWIRQWNQTLIQGVHHVISEQEKLGN